MRGASTGIVYGGLKYQARCISDVKADAENTSFLAGTLSLKEENEVHLIRLSKSGTELLCEGLFYHPNEIWDLCSCPFDPNLFSTVFASGEKYGATIWRIPELYGQSSNPQLEEIVSLKAHTCKIKCILWWPSGKHDKIISIDEEDLFLWNLDSSNKMAEVHSQESVGMLQSMSGGAWDPHDRDSVAAICDSLVQFWDLRTMKKTHSIERAHVRDVDYNPKKQHHIASAEDDGSGIFVWDLRMIKSPLVELAGHSHWTWAIRHNPQYEDLILVCPSYIPVQQSQTGYQPTHIHAHPCMYTGRHSAGTDSTVKLWFAAISQNEEMHEGLIDSPTRKVEPLLNSYNDYEDSVYGIMWSCREPTFFASLSYDGRVVVESVKSHLPRK